MNKPVYKRIWFWITILLVVLVSGGYLLIRTHFQSLVEIQVRTQLAKNPQRLYEINFKKLELHPMLHQIKLNDVVVYPRKNILDSLSKVGIYPSILAYVNVQDIRLEGINVKNVLLDGIINLNDIEIDRPKARLFITGHKSEEPKDTIDPFESINHLASSIHNSSIQDIEIINAKLSLINLEKDSLEILSCADIDLSLIDFRIDTSFKDFPIDLKSLRINIAEVKSDVLPFHNLELSGIAFNSTDSSLGIKQFQYIPKTTAQEFMNQQKFEKSWLKVKTGKISLKGFLLGDLLFSKEFICNSLRIEEPDVYVYKDKNLKWPSHQIKEIPSAAIKAIPIPINIRKVVVSNGNILFEQLSKGKPEKGSLPLTQFHLSLFNITNMSTSLNDNHIMETVVQLKLFDESLLRGNIKFDMLSSSNSYTINAELGKGKMSVFSKMLKPVANIDILEGELQSTKLKLKGNRNRMWGTLDVHYENAKIEVLSVDEENHKHKRGLLSFAANTVVRSNNIPGTPSYQTGIINYERSLDYPFIRFIWSSVFEGLKNTLIGVHNSEEELAKVGPDYVTNKMKKEKKAEKKRLRLKLKNKKTDK